MIVTPEDIRLIRPIANNIEDEARIEPYIEEAEKLYVVPAIGAELYKKIDENRYQYKDFLRGGYYNENRCRFEGLITAVSYLAYARFVRNNPVNITPFGVKYKNSQFSQDVDEKTLIRHANEAEKTGQEYLRQCAHYLRHTGELPCCKKFSTKQKFKAIGK